MIMILGRGGAGITSSLTISARLELLDKTFLLLVNTSAPEFSGVIRSEPYLFRSWGMGDRPVLPESRLQMAIWIKKKAETIASLHASCLIILKPPAASQRLQCIFLFQSFTTRIVDLQQILSCFPFILFQSFSF